jgi:hypothetical protein
VTVPTSSSACECGLDVDLASRTVDPCRLALALFVAGCAAGGDPQATASPAFLAEDSSDPSFELLGETYLLQGASEDSGTVINDFFPPGQSADAWSRTVMAMVAPPGVTTQQIMQSYVAQRSDRLAAEPYVTGRSRHDDEWIMVVVLAPEPDGTIETTVMHVFADKGEQARAYVYVERKVHDTSESEEDQVARAGALLQAIEQLDFPLKRPSPSQ